MDKNHHMNKSFLKNKQETSPAQQTENHFPLQRLRG